MPYYISHVGLKFSCVMQGENGSMLKLKFSAAVSQIRCAVFHLLNTYRCVNWSENSRQLFLRGAKYPSKVHHLKCLAVTGHYYVTGGGWKTPFQSLRKLVARVYLLVWIPILPLCILWVLKNCSSWITGCIMTRIKGNLLWLILKSW